MRNHVVLPSFSLRTKLVLSYLGVALGAILILSVVISQVVQFNFAHQQQQQFIQNEQNEAQWIGQLYHNKGDSWSTTPTGIDLNSGFGMNSHPDPHQDFTLSLILDTNKNIIYQPRDYSPLDLENQIRANMSSINPSVVKALDGQPVEDQATLQWLDANGGTSTVYYACEPIRANGKVVGALFAITQVYAKESPPANFLNSVNTAVLITGGAIALIVILFSLFLASGLTRSLKSLTAAVERMQRGDYTQRVEPPKAQDEIGHLSHAFNAMASTIETDVTELRRQDELRRDLIANIAHDLATPLTSVQGFSEALADDVITNVQIRQETAQLIGREVQRLRRLVGDMQNMTSLESGRLHLDLAPLDLSALVNETLEVVGFECEQVGITVHNSMLPDMPLVLADSDRITQVLLNLLDNARRHTPQGGTITIGAQPEHQSLTVSVSDTGTGIDPADLPHIFERFYRADRSRTTATGGSGLGLAIVKAIVTAHGGTIRAESQLGRGMRIVFTLPLADQGMR